MINLFKTHISQEAKDNVARVLESGWCGLGPETEKFEQEFAQYLGAKYAIATNSGTEALRLAVHIASRQTKRGYAVTTPNTFISSNSVLVQNDLYPVFTDIEYNTGAMLLSDAELALQTYDCGLIMLVHYAGRPVNIEDFTALSERYQVEIVHDLAHACGATYKGKLLGGDLKYACFSFHAVKNLPVGEGGMLVTNSEEVDTQARQLRWFGIDKSTFQRSQGTYTWEYDITDYGYKGHMSDVAAAIGRGQLPHVDEWNKYRATLVRRYQKWLGALDYPRPLRHTDFDCLSANHLFVVLFKTEEQRSKVISSLTDHSIQYGYHYKPNYIYHSYRDFPKMGTKNMEEFYHTALTLPLHLDLTEDDIDSICQHILEVI